MLKPSKSPRLVAFNNGLILLTKEERAKLNFTLGLPAPQWGPPTHDSIAKAATQLLRQLSRVAKHEVPLEDGAYNIEVSGWDLIDKKTPEVIYRIYDFRGDGTTTRIRFYEDGASVEQAFEESLDDVIWTPAFEGAEKCNASQACEYARRQVAEKIGEKIVNETILTLVLEC